MARYNIITFGEFKKFTKQEDFERDREHFIHAKKTLLCYLLKGFCNYDYLSEDQISQMDSLVKANLTKENYNNNKELKKRIEDGLETFTFYFGLSYELLSDEKKNEFFTMDITYENCKKMFLNVYNEYIENMKEIWPDELAICCEERGFVSFCHLAKKIIIQKDNFIGQIREYFLLDYVGYFYGFYRDNELFDKIKKKIEQLYPIYKEHYGRNRYLEKILSFFEADENDYNNEYIKKLLDDYYNEKNKNDNKYIPLKQKED